MTDDRLKNYVLHRADQDAHLSDDARLVVLAAFGDPDDLAQVLGGEDTSAQLVEALTTPDDTTVEPVGAYLQSITVQGFRGIGPKASLPLRPGPGLIVVAGRNGSGKSTLAEAVELALTGTNSRWADKAVVWSQNWRNLHAGEPAQIRIAIAEEGSGTTTIGVEWPKGADVKVDQHTRWVQRDGQKREPPSVLGWGAALEMYRPLLSYDELGGILEGKPSDFYDELHKLLGLEQLIEAIGRLDNAVKQLRQPAAELKRAREAIRPVLQTHPDPRAATALDQLKKTKPDLEAVRPLITAGTGTSIPFAWQQAQRLTTPSLDEVHAKSAALKSAAKSERQEIRRTGGLAADRARLLETGLTFHEQHGDQPCPLCGRGALNDNWALAARAALEREQAAAEGLTAARAATEQARSALVALIRGVQRPPLHDDDLTALDAARTAYDRFAEFPVDDDVALAGHAEQMLPDLERTYAALWAQAQELVTAREDAWQPVALDLADWLKKAEVARNTEPRLKIATEALKWLQANAGELRNQRLAPLAQQAKEIWAALRQESNVDLGAVRLEGQKTTRRVVLHADVDGSESEAFGVMSQGELQALALAIFIPRATSPQSPFRFLVLDDPIQAMDPSKIDGFLQVLTVLAKDRQVIVFTHDDRLPAAIRRSRAAARVIEVIRGANSAVTMTEASRPATRLLDDAFAIAADEAVPEDIKKAAVPMLCREAFEATCWEVFAAKAWARGQSRAEVEAHWERATTVRRRLALALALDAHDDAAVERWRSGGRARRDTLSVINTGLHRGVADYRSAVNDARRVIGELDELAR